MKILVTGGAGFIGSNFIRYWLHKYPDDEIVNFDALTYSGHRESLRDVESDPRYSFIQGDITSASDVDSALVGVGGIVHFAAESHVDRSIHHPEIFVHTNVLGTQVLLEAAKKRNLRFHHVSTDEVYGSLELGSQDKFHHTRRFSPNSPYAASKAGSDHLVLAYFTTYQLPVTVTNCSNNYGPYQDPEKYLPRMITHLIEGKPIEIYGDGKNVRDWLYVEDHCRAIDLVFHHGTPGDTYTVGGQSEDTSNLELAHMVMDIMGIEHDQLKFVTDRLGHDRRYAVDWSKIKDELGWEPTLTLSEGINKTVRWYQSNESWWKPIKQSSEKIYQ